MTINGVTNLVDSYQTNHWTFMKNNGQTELWRTNVLGKVQIFLSTNRPAEEIWSR